MYTSFFIFRTRLYLGFIFSELICIASGLGAYPEISDPQPGCGPTRNFELLDAKYVSLAMLFNYYILFIKFFKTFNAYYFKRKNFNFTFHV